MYTYKYKSVIGYYEKHGTMSVSKRLAQIPYAQAGYDVYDSGVKKLYSYDSHIMDVGPDGWAQVNTVCFFSRTTRNHVNAFLIELGSTWTINDLREEYKKGNFDEDGYFEFNIYRK